MGIFIYSRYIGELAIRVYCPIIESATQTYSDRQISPKTALRAPFLSEDQVRESIGRLDFGRPCTGFVEYFRDFFEGNAFTT